MICNHTAGKERREEEEKRREEEEKKKRREEEGEVIDREGEERYCRNS